MTPAELRSLMYGANLRSGSLGELIGVGAAQVRDWTSGRRPVPAKYIPKIEAATRSRQPAKPPRSRQRDTTYTVPAAPRTPKRLAALPQRDTTYTVPAKPALRQAQDRPAQPKRAKRRRGKPRKLRMVDPASIDAKRPVPVADEASLATTIADLAAGFASILMPAIIGGPAMAKPVAPTTPVAVAPLITPTRQAAPSGRDVAPLSWIAGDVFPGQLQGQRCSASVAMRDAFGVSRPGFCGQPCAPGRAHCPTHAPVADAAARRIMAAR
jgi:hypothetical protein